VLPSENPSTTRSHTSQPHAGSTRGRRSDDQLRYTWHLYLKCDSALNETWNLSSEGIQQHALREPSGRIRKQLRFPGERPRLSLASARGVASEGDFVKQTKAPLERS
jgi:hypothetical protein